MVCRRGFALSFCHFGNSSGLSYCAIAFALFFLRLFRLAFYRRFCRCISIRCFLRLWVRSPVRVPTLSPAWSPSRCPTSASRAKLSSSAVHAPALRGHISALQTSAGSTLECGASSTSAGHRSSLHHHIPASKAPAACAGTSALEALTESTWTSALPARAWPAGSSALPTLDVSVRTLTKRTIWSSWSLKALTVSTWTSALPALAVSTWASALPAPAVSTGTSALPAPDILIRVLGEGAKWPRSPGIIRLYGIRVCIHLWPAGHHASPSGSVASTLTTYPSRPRACLPGKRLTGQNRQCQPCNNRCYGFCPFHFQFLSLIFHSTAFLIPGFGSFYEVRGARWKKVTLYFRFSVADTWGIN